RDARGLVESRRLRRGLEHLGVGEGDVVRKVLALGRKAERGTASPRDAVPAVDEGIEHDAEELVGQLERALLRAGRSFSGEERQRVAEIDAGEPEEVRERSR